MYISLNGFIIYIYLMLIHLMWAHSMKGRLLKKKKKKPRGMIKITSAWSTSAWWYISLGIKNIKSRPRARCSIDGQDHSTPNQSNGGKFVYPRSHCYRKTTVHDPPRGEKHRIIIAFDPTDLNILFLHPTPLLSSLSLKSLVRELILSDHQTFRRRCIIFV